MRCLQLLETVLKSYPSISHLLTEKHLSYIWSLLTNLLKQNLDPVYLAAILHYCNVLIQMTKEQAQYLLPTLYTLLPNAIHSRNEEVRAECCRCYGWCCQVFPNVCCWMNMNMNMNINL